MIRPALTEIGIFLIPFAVYALFLMARRTGVLTQAAWPLHVLAKLLLGALLLVVLSFILWRISPARRRSRPTFPPISTTASSCQELKNLESKNPEAANERAARA
jgi:hypothetical protein